MGLFFTNSTRSLALAVSLIACGVPATVRAQAQDNTVLVDSSPLLADYDRGRNVSVTQKPRPEYDALGIRAGSFLILPRVAVNGGATDNVYAAATNEVSDLFATLSPSFSASSDFSRHQLAIGAGASLRRYLDESTRNQDEWYANLLGRADIGSDFALTGELQASKNQESPFVGAVSSDQAALSSYQRRTAIVRGQYVASRSRVTLAYDFNDFEFDDITFASGTRLSQADRDRKIKRITAQYEYAISPSLSLYAQGSHAKTDYDRLLLNGQPNRDSKADRFIAGVKFDLSAFIRGSIGAGYLHRNYRSPIYKDINGFSFEGQIEYFPTELTTVTLRVRRVLDDSSIGSTSAFFDNQAALRVDHELRYNVIVNVNGAYTHQKYVDSPLKSDIYRLGGGARYLLTRSLQLTADVNYSGRTQNDLFGGNIKEFSGAIGIVLQR